MAPSKMANPKLKNGNTAWRNSVIQAITASSRRTHGPPFVQSHRTLSPFKQPDLNWYFETANTSPENRKQVLEMIEHAPDSARRLFKLSTEDGKIVWWWQRLALIARNA